MYIHIYCVQSELGDVYTVTFTSSASGVSAITATYYDTLPVAIALVALGSSPGGRFFVAVGVGVGVCVCVCVCVLCVCFV